jgi:ABC-2 type transport system ATP-binding protein
MTRRIGLAQALINDPDLVLLDEPTSGLDPIGTREMKDLIVRLRDQGKTVVMCSHQLADVQDVTDRIAILYAGELKVLGSVNDVLKQEEKTELLTSRLSPEAVADIEAVLKKHGADLLSLDHPTSTLEDLFLRTVDESIARPGRRFVQEEPATASVAGGSNGAGDASKS